MGSTFIFAIVILLYGSVGAQPQPFSSANGGLSLLTYRCIYLTSSATPGTALQMTPQISGSVSYNPAGGNLVVTFTASANHGLASGQSVVIAGATDTWINGTWKITVTGATTFTFNLSSLGPSTASDSGLTLTYSVMAQWVLLVADKGNAASISFGPNLNADLDSTTLSGTVPESAYELKCPTGAKIDLSQWYFKSASASMKLRVLFL